MQKSVEVKQGKKKGPLPMALAQILLFALLGGLGYATIVKESETNALLASLGKSISVAYGGLERAFSKKTKPAS
jgi:hypothetical protein